MDRTGGSGRVDVVTFAEGGGGGIVNKLSAKGL